jgi:hypothetical protein
MTWLAGAMLYLAAAPFALMLWNLTLLKRPVPAPGGHKLSILIPARNEAATIAQALTAVLANEHPDYEVIVLDDNSEDDTTAIVSRFAAADARVTLYSAPPLPPGWSGKMRACDLLSQHAIGDLLVFIDCDVTLTSHCLEALDAFMTGRPHVAYASGIPRQMTATLGEKLVVPLICFLLAAYLPVFAMRRSTSPAMAAGCGQLAVMRRDAYRAVGGHAAIARTMHDGLKLPRLFRRQGYATDLFDATNLASCRMYATAPQVWHGFSKNATEGLATPRALPVWTIVLGGGQILPFLLLPFLLLPFVLCGVIAGTAALLVCMAAALSLSTRLVIALRFRNSLLGAVLHPLGIAIMLTIQWVALVNANRKRPSEWRGRSYQVDEIP